MTVEDASTFIYEPNEAGCWIWSGYADRNGYGRIYDRTRKRIEWAHRYSYRRHNGEIPDGYEVDHMCVTPLCVNPEHLQVLTHTEHVRVTMSRLGKDDLHKAAAVLRESGATYAEIGEALGLAGRGTAADAVLAAIRKGLVEADSIPRAERLSDDQSADIVDLVALGVPQSVVAELFGIHNSQVSRISRGLSSGHRRAREAVCAECMTAKGDYKADRKRAVA